MNKVARIFMILAAISALAFFAIGVASIYILVLYSSGNSQVTNGINQLLENYGLIQYYNNGNSSATSVDVIMYVSIVASFGIVMGIMSIPCAINSLIAIRRHSKGRFIGVIITGAIGYNLIAVLAGILNIIAISRDRNY